MKQYKFQALITLYDGSDDDRDATLRSSPRRMVLRGRNEESGRSQIYTALSAATMRGPSGLAALASWQRCGWLVMT